MNTCKELLNIVYEIKACTTPERVSRVDPKCPQRRMSPLNYLLVPNPFGQLGFLQHWPGTAVRVQDGGKFL